MTIQQKIEKKRERNEFAVAFAVLSFVLVFLLGIAGYDVIGNYNHPANGSEAYASALMVNPNGQKTDTGKSGVYLTTTTVNVRENPNLSAKVMGYIDTGASIEATPAEEGWYYVEAIKGYVSKDYIVEAPSIKRIGVVTKIPEMSAHLIGNANTTIPQNAITKNLTDTKFLDTNYCKQYTENTVEGFTKAQDIKQNYHRAISTNPTEASNLSAEEVEYLVKGTGLEGIGSAVIDVENKYGVNAFFTIAVAELESGYGSSYLARAQNNIFGLDPYNGGMTFGTKSACVQYFGKLIRNHYFNNGLDTPYAINAVYEPCNSAWGDNVAHLMETNRGKLNR